MLHTHRQKDENTHTDVIPKLTNDRRDDFQMNHVIGFPRMIGDGIGCYATILSLIWLADIVDHKTSAGQQPVMIWRKKNPKISVHFIDLDYKRHIYSY